MKTTHWAIGITSIALAMTMGTTANAEPTYVIDDLLASASFGNSGDGTELDWIREKTGDDTLEMDFKIDDKDNDFNVTANGNDSWYINVSPNEPGYFLLKLGVPGNSSLADHYLFENIGELDKLVWSNEQVNFLTGGNCGLTGGGPNSNNCNIGRLSHYIGTGSNGGDTTTDPKEVDVPEPISLLLFGAGLAGLGWTRRRKSA